MHSEDTLSSGLTLDATFGFASANDSSVEQGRDLTIQGMNPHRQGGRSAAEMQRALNAVMNTPGVQVQPDPAIGLTLGSFRFVSICR